MYLVFSKTKTEVFKNELLFQNFHLSYSLDKKEVFFENNALILFLKTNYSENYINNKLSKSEGINSNDINKAFQKDGFWVVLDKKSNKVTFNRDLAGLCTCYYFIDENEVHISTNVHSLAKSKARELNRETIFQLLYFDFLWDGQTIYNNISQLKVGGEIILNHNLEVISNKFLQPNITEQENLLTEQENIQSLRQEIVEAHKRYVNEENVVFLSGGIDSVAMLIALDDLTDKNNIENHSFKVKGTTQDETEYSKSIANHLDIKLSIIERDLSDEINVKIFKEGITKMNNPYPGMWIFGNQIDDANLKTYFAGQDTRLHTPSLNILDAIAFNIFHLSRYFSPLYYLIDIIFYPLKLMFNFSLKRKGITNKYFLGLRRALYLFNTKRYLQLVYFKVDKAILSSYKLPTKYFDGIINNYKFSLKGIKSKRSLYNTIVSKKWIEQYVNDMRYMIDMVNIHGGKLAMPFYDMDLAKFSATIPFDLSIKNMKGKSQFNDKDSTIHKYVLREALVDKIDKKTYLRSKAVSRTGHIIFNQGLDNILKEIVKKDLVSSNSFIKDFELGRFLERFLKNKKKWSMTDDKYLLKVYHLTTLIVYSQNIKQK